MRRIATAFGLAAAVIAAALIGAGAASAAELPETAGVVTSKASTVISSTGLAGGTTTISGTARHTFTAKVTTGDGQPDAGRVVQLQQWDDTANEWAPYNYARANSSGEWTTSVPPANRAVKWRLRAPATADSAEDTSPPATINRVRETVSVKTTGFTGTSSALAHVDLTFAVDAPTRAKVYLQKLVDGRWVQAKTAYVVAGEVSYRIPAAGGNSAATSDPQFRVIVPSFATGYRDTHSAARTVKIENPLRYTGERRAYFGLVASHCPSALLVIDETLIAKGASGWANMRANTVHMKPGVPLQHQRYVANHECAHLKQWEMYGHNWAAFQAAADGVYGGGLEYGYERMADCVANAWHPVSYWGYRRGCAGQMGVVGNVTAGGGKYFNV